MQLSHWLVVAGILISISGSYAYIRDTLKGNTKPNRISWLMWGLGPLIGAAAGFSVNADPWTSARVLAAGLVPLVIVGASFANKNSYWKLTSFDFICGAFSIAALVVWLFADSPRSAIILAVIGDAFACIPTIYKSWKFPETETGIAYIGYILSVLLVFPAIPVWNLENTAFPIYLLTANSIMALAVYKKHFFKSYESSTN